MRIPFNQVKATHAAALLLNLSPGRRMNYMKLIKLLYLADREALLTWGRPITTDRYVSMDHGPVVSQIYGLIREEPDPRASSPSYWQQRIRPVDRYQVELAQPIDTDELSQAECDLISRLHERHGRKDQWQLRDETHDLPEWVDPEGSSIPIQIRDILRAGHKTEAEIAEIEAELEALALAESLG